MDFQITRRKLFVLLSIVIVLIAVPLTLYLTQQKQETRSNASQTDPVIATVNGVQIHQSDLKKGDLEGYDTDTAKNTAIERAILDFAVTELGLSVDESEIDQVASDGGMSSEEAKYEIIRNKVIAAKVRYVKAISLGFWVPVSSDQSNYTTQEWETVQKQIVDGRKAMESAASSLSTSDDAVTIASDLIKTYTSLSDVLAMNGLIFSQIDEGDKADSATPALYEYGFSNFDPETRDKVFASTNKVGDIISVSNTSASGGGSVFKITEIGTGTEDSYDSWLAREKAKVQSQ